MGYTWSGVTAGTTKISITEANDIRNRANTLINNLRDDDGCGIYGCSGLSTSLPSSVSSGGSINTTWFDNMRATIDAIDNNKNDCATAYWTAKGWYKSDYRSSYNSTRLAVLVSNSYTTNHSGRTDNSCSRVYTLQHISYYTNNGCSSVKVSYYTADTAD